MSNNGNAGNGISFTCFLFPLFLALKLAKVIDWSWWWVTAPLWVPLALSLGVLLLGAILSSLTGASFNHFNSYLRNMTKAKQRR